MFITWNILVTASSDIICASSMVAILWKEILSNLFLHPLYLLLSCMSLPLQSLVMVVHQPYRWAWCVHQQLPEKVAVLLNFVQITSTPPLIWTTCTTFFEHQCAQKFGQGSPLPSPSPNWPNIYSLWKVDKEFGQGPHPPHLDKIQRTATFFREIFPYTMPIYIFVEV